MNNRFNSIQNRLISSFQSATKRTGFTLIELMVAMSIIAILASVGFVTYSNAQKSSRDARRKQDLKAIAVGLELYYEQNKQYPYTATGACTLTGNGYIQCLSNGASPWITGLDTTYINSMPVDPFKNQGDPVPVGTAYFGYGFRSYASGACAATSNGQNFTLSARLENPQDPDRLGAKPKSFCNLPSNDLQTVHGFDPNLYVVTNF